MPPDKLLYAYLANEVMIKGFCPPGLMEQKSWLLQFNRSLRDFWEAGDCYPAPKVGEGNRLCATIDIATALDLSFEYCIDTVSKFVVSFMYAPPVNSKELMWTHDVDGTFYKFPEQDFLTLHNQRNLYLRRATLVDVEAVVDGLLLHPSSHQHIESPIDEHEIRIGGGISNPFQYLFHLRYQLCPMVLKKVAERRRLIDLFFNAITTGSSITKADLMAQPTVE